jgi:hypothetical protein
MQSFVSFRLSRLSIVLASLLVIVVTAAAVLLLVVGGAGASSSLSLGHFAGYQWFGKVRSVGASWTVPTISLGSHDGSAGTWIGAQGPGRTNSSPFIQVGTNEERRATPLGPLTLYYAFWSDVRHHFHPQHLFEVNPGDQISVSLHLQRQHWTVSISDPTKRSHAHFSTRDETKGTFNTAQWLQEDVDEPNGDTPYPYPQTSNVRFRKLAVNGDPPSYSAVYSQWMSLPGIDLAPSALAGDSFSISRQTLSSPGKRYLQIVKPEQAAANSKQLHCRHDAMVDHQPVRDQARVLKLDLRDPHD